MKRVGHNNIMAESLNLELSEQPQPRGLELPIPHIIGHFDLGKATEAFANPPADPELRVDIGLKFEPESYYSDERLDNMHIRESKPGVPPLYPESAMWHLDPTNIGLVGSSHNTTQFAVGRLPEGMKYDRLLEANSTKPEVLDRYIKVLVALGRVSISQPEPGEIVQINKLNMHRFNPNGASEDDPDRITVSGNVLRNPRRT